MNIFESILRDVSRDPVLSVGCLGLFVLFVLLMMFFEMISLLPLALQIIILLLFVGALIYGLYKMIKAKWALEQQISKEVMKRDGASARLRSYHAKTPQPQTCEPLPQKLTREMIDEYWRINMAQIEKAVARLPEIYAKTLTSGKRAEMMDNYKLAYLRYKAVADAGYFEGMYFLVWLCCHKMNDWHQGLHWMEKALAACSCPGTEEERLLLEDLRLMADEDMLTDEERLLAEVLLEEYDPDAQEEEEPSFDDDFDDSSDDSDDDDTPDYFGNFNKYDRSIADNRRHRARGSANWTSREDWDCGNSYEDGMSGFDNYEDNDF